MTNEGLTDLKWMLNKWQNILKDLPDLEKLTNLESEIKQRQRLKDDASAALKVAEDKVRTAEAKAKELEDLSKQKFEEVQVELVKRLQEAEAQATAIVQAAKNQEAVIQARIKKAQDTLSNLTK